MTSLVIGGTLFIGRVLVAKLLARGHEVAVLHRKPTHDLGPDVEGLQADRNDPLAVKAAVAGRSFDFVFDNVFDWGHGTTAAQVEGTARVFANLRRYVFMSSVAAYGESGGLEPRHEDNLLVPDDHHDLYSRHKAMSERALLAMHAREGFPAVTLRPPFVYGPVNPFYREAFFFQRFADGRPVIVPEDGSRLMQFIHVADLAECEILAAEKDGTAGMAFNIAEPDPVSQLQFVQTLAKAAGQDARIVPFPRADLLAAGGQVMGPRLYFGEYLDLPPIPQDCSRMQRILNFTPRSLADGMSESYEWWKSQGRQRYPAPDYTLEDSVLPQVAD